MKKLNIELSVRYMDAKSIIVTSSMLSNEEIPADQMQAPGRTATPAAPGCFRN